MFDRIIRVAVNRRSYGYSTGVVAQYLLAIRYATSIEEAHLLSRAAEVYERMLRRDVQLERARGRRR